MSQQKYTIYRSVLGVEIPVQVHIEQRRAQRATLGVNGLLVRVPKSMILELDKVVHWSLQWAEKVLKKNSAWLQKYMPLPDFPFIMQVLGKPTKVFITQKKTAGVRAKYTTSGIQLLDGMTHAKAAEKNYAYRFVLHKLLGQLYQKPFEARVAEINNRTFNFNYAGVKLKFVQSKWGSCNSKKELVFSSKLLLCPDFVMDYIIIHELAHLKEMNHSDRFWKLVETYDPHYKKAERWLTKHGNKVALEQLIIQHQRPANLD